MPCNAGLHGDSLEIRHCSDSLPACAGLTLHSSGICEDHLVVGTQTGDCLFLDISRGGLAVSSFPAHRQGRVCSDASQACNLNRVVPHLCCAVSVATSSDVQAL